MTPPTVQIKSYFIFRIIQTSPSSLVYFQDLELSLKAIKTQYYNDGVSKPQWFRAALSALPTWGDNSLPIHLRTETDPIPEMFIVFWIWEEGQRPGTKWETG